MSTFPTRRLVVKIGLLLGLEIAMAPAHARDMPPKHIPRIGYLTGKYPLFIAAFDGELRKLGYRYGENIVVETRISRPNSDDLDAQAAELAHMDIDLIVAAALPQALAVRRYNPKMPMVVATAPGLIANGFAKSLDHPGGNVTGMDELPPGITSRRLKLLKLAAPSISHVALLSTTPGTGGHEMQLEDAQRGAAEAGVQVKAYRVRSLPDLEPALAAMRADKMDGLVSFQGALALGNAKMIADFAARSKIPAIYQSKLFIDAGGLMALAPDQEEQFREAARYVDRILRGARPGDLPIRHPARYYLTFNAAAATALELSPPRDFMSQVNEIV